MSTDLQRTIHAAPATRFQIAAIAVGVGLNMLDGFDILAMSFAASGVKAEWHLQDGQLGALLSAGLIGMGLGSLILGPCADRFGRRAVVLFSVALAGLGMLAAALSDSYATLLALRAITGLGIGGTIASVAVIVSEYAPDRWRGTALAAYSTGYPVGATLGGALTAYAIPHFGWRSAFVIGGVMSLLLLPLAWARLPESVDSLLTRRPPGALEKINALLQKMRQAPVARLPELDRSSERLDYGAQLRILLVPRTLLVWAMFFCTMAGFYFIVSWTPRLLTAAGLSATQGLTGGVLLNLGGIAGCGGYALIASRFDNHRLLLGSLIGSALLIVAFALTLSDLSLALWTALALGIITNGAMAGLYAVGPPLYPTAVRATGMGWAIGIGRLGAILAPLAVGALLERGWSGAELYRLFCIPFALAAIGMGILGPSPSRPKAVV
jgi:benzoate transport